MSGNTSGKQTSGNTSGKKLLLPVEVQDVLHVPERIELHGEEFRWTVMNLGNKTGPFSARPVDGCLRAFVKLADASPEAVLAFAQKYGPLGIVPLVELRHGETWTRAHYREPVSLYKALAKRLWSIVRVMQQIRSDQPVSPEIIREMVPPSIQAAWDTQRTSDSPNDQKPWAYRKLLKAAFMWHGSATTKLGVSGEAEGSGEWAEHVKMRWPRQFVDFGHWLDGIGWDKEQDVIWGLEEATTKIEAAQNKEELSDEDAPLLTPQQVAYIHQHADPYSAYWANIVGRSPRPDQRPSPVFNALSFQLMQNITLDERSFFCGNCHELKTRGTEESKPRTDRAEYCDSECKAEARQKFDRERKAKANAAKRAAAKDASPPPS